MGLPRGLLVSVVSLPEGSCLAFDPPGGRVKWLPIKLFTLPLGGSAVRYERPGRGGAVGWSPASATHPPGLRVCARSGGLAEKWTRPRPVGYLAAGHAAARHA